MKSKLKYFSSRIGLIINSFGLIQAIPLVFSFFHSENQAISLGFVGSMCVTFLTGSILMKFGADRSYKPDKWSGFVLAALVALSLNIMGALPYLFVMGLDVDEAIFETASGITTTGLTIFNHVEDVPAAILLYRALTQWFGGGLFLVFFALIGFRSEDQFLLGYSNTMHSFKFSKRFSNLNRGVIAFLILYVCLTFFQTIWYALIGVPIFEAAAHSLTTVSAGGFSTFNEGFVQGLGFEGMRHNVLVYSFATFMIMTGVGYFLYIKALSKDFSAIYKNKELRGYVSITLGCIFVLILLKWLSVGLDSMDFEKSLLLVTSAISSVGIQLETGTLLPEIVFILLILTAMGGMIGSTSGGLKVNRIRVALKSIKYEADHIFKPSQVVSTLKLDDRPIDTKAVLKLMTLVFAWTVVALIGIISLQVSTDLSGELITKSVIGALSNGGFIRSSMIEFSQLNPFALLIYVVIMTVGRLEIFPCLILFHIKAWKY